MSKLIGESYGIITDDKLFVNCLKDYFRKNNNGNIYDHKGLFFCESKKNGITYTFYIPDYDLVKDLPLETLKRKYGNII